MENEKTEHQIVKSIVKHMDGWTYNEKRSVRDGRPLAVAYATHTSGATFFIRQGTYGSYQGKLQITGALPDRTASGQQVYTGRSECRPEIGCSATKAPERIAKDVLRRLVPDLMELHQAMVERVAEHNAHELGQEKLRQRLAKAGGGRAQSHNDSGFTVASDNIEGWVSGKVHGPQSVTLDMHSMDADTALAVVKLIATRNKKAAK